jgi:HemX protein
VIIAKWFLFAAALFYLGGAAMVAAAFAQGRRSRLVRGEALAGAGLAFHLLACTTCPYGAMNLQHVFSLLAFVMAAIYFILRLFRRIEGLAIFVFPLAFCFAFVALVLPQEAGTGPHLPHILFLLHILVVVAGIGGIFFGILYSFLYLLQERALKAKRWTDGPSFLPSLAKCDSWSIHSLWGGFALYTLGIGLGVVWSAVRKGVLVSGSLKELAALIAWGVFAALLVIRFQTGLRGRKAFLLYTVGVLSILAAIAGIRVF